MAQSENINEKLNITNKASKVPEGTQEQKVARKIPAIILGINKDAQDKLARELYAHHYAISKQNH